MTATFLFSSLSTHYCKQNLRPESGSMFAQLANQYSVYCASDCFSLFVPPMQMNAHLYSSNCILNILSSVFLLVGFASRSTSQRMEGRRLDLPEQIESGFRADDGIQRNITRSLKSIFRERMCSGKTVVFKTVRARRSNCWKKLSLVYKCWREVTGGICCVCESQIDG